jgi:molybdopterin synthase catalytic subunit
MITISPAPFEPSEALRRFERDASGCGAIVSFSGYVRGEARNERVERLCLEDFQPMTENGIAEVVRSASARWSLAAARVIHRIGDILPGEAIVFVATAAVHRRAAFEAADFLMDYLKTEAFFWKKEVAATGSVWIEPRAEDYIDRNRWNAPKDC